MSPKPGRVELRILELLRSIERLRPAKIAFEIAGRAEPTAALSASVRRALASLRKKGRVVRVMDYWMLAETWQQAEMRRQREREREEELWRQRQVEERKKKQSGDSRTEEKDWPELTTNDTLHGEIDYGVAGRRLVKILGLLGSPHEAEVLNAARQAEHIRRRLRLSWAKIIVLPDRDAKTQEGTATVAYGPNFRRPS